jgi:cellulose synthase/poly-beta-1,6-N-acetylglucosamine synthase-like glycosyltransferase
VRYDPGVPPSDVTLVIPGRNARATVDACLASVVPMLDDGTLQEIIFVDDGSTDGTGELVARFPVTCLRGPGAGAGAARNLGWRAATTPLIWFIDSDCVAEPDALTTLLPALDDAGVGAAGGSYGNMRPGSLLATLIHEEIVERHMAMPGEVNFLATFNVLYRRAALEQVGGFDERFLKAQDAELAFRVKRAGWRLRFDRRSQVKHFHQEELWKYLKVQWQQGYWRALLYVEHPDRLAGDSYSGVTDHIQPMLAVAALGLLPFSLLPPVALAEATVLAALAAAQLPMTSRIVRRTRRPELASHAAMSFTRAFARGIGLGLGTARALLQRGRDAT